MSRGYLDQRLFLRVVELGSLRAAAREFEMEASSVSRRLSRLEARLNVTLLDRRAGSSVATDAGQQYYHALRGLLSQIDLVEAGIARRPNALRGVLRVAACADFGRDHVADWVLAFRARNPGLEIELTLSDPPPAPDEAHLDFAIATHEIAPRPGLGIQHLGVCEQVLVAAPSYVAQAGAPQVPADLVRLRHVFCTRTEQSAALILTGPDGRAHSIRRRGVLHLGALDPARRATLQGEGVLTCPLWAVSDAVTRGELEVLLPDHPPLPVPILVLWPEAYMLPGRIPAFVAHAQSEFARIPGARPAH